MYIYIDIFIDIFYICIYIKTVIKLVTRCTFVELSSPGEAYYAMKSQYIFV